MKVVVLLLVGVCVATGTVGDTIQDGINSAVDTAGTYISGSNEDCSSCAFNTLDPFSTDATGEVANECCAYFKSGCCTSTENSFLHIMFIVAIVGGVALFLIIAVCIGGCICCCCCCAACAGGSGRRLQPNRPPQYQPLQSPVSAVHVTSSSSVTTGYPC